MNRYSVERCQCLLVDQGLSNEMRMLAETVVALATGAEEAEQIANQAYERTAILLERLAAAEIRLAELESKTKQG
jgi:hypothetical protein